MKTQMVVVSAALSLLACTAGNPEMRPGDDCLRCHGGHPGGPETGPVEHEGAFSLAGTAYGNPDADAQAGVGGVVVEITDATGTVRELRTNDAGNFYTVEPVVFPVEACVARTGNIRCMPAPAPNGACNYCHTLPAQGGAAGRIGAP